MKLKSEMLKNLRDYVRSKKPDMSMGIEWVSDPTSMHADYIHSVAPNLHITPQRATKGGAPRTAHAPMYQYTFPEVYVTNRDIYNNSDVPRRCNLTFMRGWREDACIFRCRATVDSAPVYKDYLAKICALRDNFRDETLNATFRDTDLAQSSNPDLEYQTFENGDTIAVVTTQSYKDKVESKFTVKGAKFVKSDGIGDFKVSGEGENAKVELKKDALVVLIFSKK